MLERITNSLKTLTADAGYIAETLAELIFSYAGTCVLAATAGVIIVALLGFTPATLIVAHLLGVGAGVFNAKFNTVAG